jgi:outer membrane protein OmpA-like peptidoglycan-associated protein
LTGVNIEIFNKTLQKTELNLKKHPQNRLSFHFKSGNEYVIMFRKEGFMIKRVNAKIGIDGCTACFDGLNTLTPLKEGERSSIVNLDLMMREINEGDRVILPTVQFQNKSADLSEDAKKALNELAVVLKDNANILSQLEVHTDARGTANDNLMLSKKRATTITEYLVSRGVSKGDFYVKGYGERKIVNHCTDNVDCAEVQHRKNRRIVLCLSHYLFLQFFHHLLFEQ